MVNMYAGNNCWAAGLVQVEQICILAGCNLNYLLIHYNSTQHSY